MKRKLFVALNHLTVPPRCANARYARTTFARSLIPISAMSWGLEPVRRDRQGSDQPADLFLGHHALDILGLALDAVARAPVRLDRQAGDDGIDAALLDVGNRY